MPELFSAKLRYIRRQHGMTQGELASQLSLASYTYIARLEADQRTPSLNLVVRLARLFDQSTDYLLRDTIAVETALASTINPLANGETTPQLLGVKLRALRLRRGWSQTEVARRLGLARQGYISNLEAGRKAPSLDLVVQIADLLGVTTDYLLRDTLPVEANV